MLRAVAGGLELEVWAQPGAARERIVGRHGGKLKIQVRAAPERGHANEAICELLARELGLGKRAVRLLHGEGWRDKRVFIEGDPPDLIARLERLLGQG